MRSGRLLAEESPRVLLTKYNCQSLEEVFLKLSRRQGSDGQPQEAPLNIANNISLVSYISIIFGCINIHCAAIEHGVLCRQIFVSYVSQVRSYFQKVDNDNA
jgi:hypothetical protein